MVYAKRHQDKLVERAKSIYNDPNISDQIYEAFYNVPRHHFIPVYRKFDSDKWLEVSERNLTDHLEDLYQDSPLVIFGSVDDFKQKVGTKPVSTISQPSFVLKMIDMLKLESGHKVYELGGGSGFNAALMGQLVGEKGRVVSVEIIPELVERARKSIEKLEIKNVTMELGDGGDCSSSEEQYDRAVFTAGSFDLPKIFYSKIKEGGMLLFVLKNKGGGDSLLLLKKCGDHFESIESLSCGFVPVTGKYHMDNMEAITLNDLLKEYDLNKISEKPFYWAGCQSHKSFVWQTQALRFYLTITDPQYEAIEFEDGNSAFGILDRENRSLMVAYHDRIVSFGSLVAQEHFFSKMDEWVQMGMPGVTNMKVRAYPIGKKVAGQWLVKRRESQFVWEI